MIAILKQKILSLISDVLFHRHYLIVPYLEDGQISALKLVHKVRSETEMLMLYCEAYNLYMLAVITAKIPGDIVEVGVYKGGAVN